MHTVSWPSLLPCFPFPFILSFFLESLLFEWSLRRVLTAKKNDLGYITSPYRTMPQEEGRLVKAQKAKSSPNDITPLPRILIMYLIFCDLTSTSLQGWHVLSPFFIRQINVVGWIYLLIPKAFDRITIKNEWTHKNKEWKRKRQSARGTMGGWKVDRCIVTELYLLLGTTKCLQKREA